MENKPVMLTNPKEIEIKDKEEETVKLIDTQIRNKKEALIKMRLKDLKKLHILKDIKKKRFKKLMVLDYPDKEEVWIDDGTYSGHLLITFLKVTEAEVNDNDFKTQLRYY